MSDAPGTTPAFRDPRGLFLPVLTPGEAALLIDDAGLVMAGQWISADTDAGPEIGAALSGVADEVQRAMRHLGLGAWQSIVVETAEAPLALTPVPLDDSASALLVVAAARHGPLGALRRTAAACHRTATRWLGVGVGP